MRRSLAIVCLVLAALASTASARELTQLSRLPKVDLPPIVDFLPPLEKANMMPINEFLNKTGLPSWEEMGLPPISELMRPVGPPRSVVSKLPSRAEVAKLANDTLTQVINEMLPPELKALASVQLPKLMLHAAKGSKGQLPLFKLPQLPGNLPPLADIVKALPPMDAAAVQVLPGFPSVKLPPPTDIMKFLESAAQVLHSMPKPSNMPTLAEIINIVNAISNNVGSVVAAQPSG